MKDAMKKKEYNYETWLGGHERRKTMMEKLERSLVPYELFAAIKLHNDKVTREGQVELGGNTYYYKVEYDYTCIGHDVYDAVITAISLEDRWNDILMGYNKFKVVMDGDAVKTIYSDGEDYFHRVIEMFENEDTEGLYRNRSVYINNLLARYILLRLLEEHRSDMKLLRTARWGKKRDVFVMAKTDDQKEMLMYAFSKREAMEMARQYNGICDDLTVIYFFNQDFERDGNTHGYKTETTKIVSIRSFYMDLTSDAKERLRLERQIFTLVSLLYNEHLRWDIGRIEKVISNPPMYGQHQAEQKAKFREMKKAGKQASGKPWWEKIYRTLLEDALNVLSDDPKSNEDIFHFLCAANMVNAYVNLCNQKGRFTRPQMQRMFQAKNQIFRCLLTLLHEHNPHVKIKMSQLPAVLVNMTIENRPFQISFRGMDNYTLEKFRKAGIPMDGKFEGFFLQPIATALYQYSCMLRWAKE